MSKTPIRPEDTHAARDWLCVGKSVESLARAFAEHRRAALEEAAEQCAFRVSAAREMGIADRAESAAACVKAIRKLIDGEGA